MHLIKKKQKTKTCKSNQAKNPKKGKKGKKNQQKSILTLSLCEFFFNVQIIRA